MSPKSTPPAADAPVSSEDVADATALQKKARLGIVSLVLRTIALQLVVLGGNVYLYRLLSPADFGAFAIVQFAVAFFAFFGDAGLGGALIQQKEEPSQRALSSVWLLQIMISVVVLVLVAGGAPIIVKFWPDMPKQGVWILRALSLEFLLTAMRVVPSILMERHLQFGRLSVLEVILNVSFYVTAVFFARLGWGIAALTAAVLVQGVLGVVGAYAMRPWRPSFVFDRKLLRPIVRFGITMQMKQILGFISGAAIPVYAGRALGQTAVGYMNWAQTTAYFPLRLVDIISRVSFPLYSRLQRNEALFAKTLEKSVQICALGTMVCTALFLGLGPALVDVIFTEKWRPALPAFYSFAVAISIGFLIPVVATALDGLGKPQVTIRVSIYTTSAVWILNPLGAHFFGMMGFVVGHCIVVVLGNLAMIVIVHNLMPRVRLWPRLRTPAIAGAVAALVGRFALLPWAGRIYTLPIAVLLVVGVFAGIVRLVDRNLLRESVALVKDKKLDVGEETEAPVESPPSRPPASAGI